MSLAESIDLFADTQTVAGGSSGAPSAAIERSSDVRRRSGALDFGGVVTVVKRMQGRPESSATVAIVDKGVVEVFLEHMQALSERNMLDAALDYVFDTMDRWFDKGSFELSNRVLRAVDPSRTHEDLLIGLLTISHTARSHLTARADLLARAREVLEHRLGVRQANRALSGLE